MTTYAIGDLHGCLTPLKRLLDKINYDPVVDHLWFTGDLVNRGPESLKTLRFVKALGEDTVCVLGNHDLHLLAVAYNIRKPSSKDTLDSILAADDIEELMIWLRHLPLLHQNNKFGVTLVHAGIYPGWTLKQAQAMASEVERELRSDEFMAFLHRMYGNKPARWSKKLGKHRRRRFAVNAFTRMRYCDNEGALDFSYNAQPSAAPAGLVPWHSVPNRVQLPFPVLFGHWSSHPAMAPPGIVPLDRGCVWGGSLVALDVAGGENFIVGCDVN